MKFLIPCDEANHVCDKNQYKEASLWELIKLNIHLIYCKACRQYTIKNTKLTKEIKRGGEIEYLDTSAKSEMKQELKKALEEASNQ